MTGGQDGPSGVFRGKTYASVTGLPTEKTPPVNQKIIMLQKNLRDLVASRRDGVTLNEARGSCPLLFDPEVLQNFYSVRQLLSSLPSVVRLEGYGVQTRLYAPQQGSSCQISNLSSQ